MRPIAKGGTLLSFVYPSSGRLVFPPVEREEEGEEEEEVCINWATDRNWQTKLLCTRKVTQLNLLCQKSVIVQSSNMRLCLRDGSAQTIVGDATLREKLQIGLFISPSQCILTPGQPVSALILWCQASRRVVTGLPSLKSLI